MKYLKIILLLILTATINFSGLTQQSKLIIDFKDTSITYPLVYRSIDSLKSSKLVAYYAFDSTKKAIEKNFYNGQISGVYQEYYPNGKLRIFKVYQFGLQHGDWAKYDSTGYLTEKAIYRNGIMNGFYINRLEKYQGKYKDGKKNGKWEYNLNTPNYYKRYYEAGEPIGKAPIFSNLNLFKKKDSINGTPIVSGKDELNETEKASLQIIAEKDTFLYLIRYISRDSIAHPTMRKAVFVEKPNQLAVLKYIYQGQLNGLYKEYFPNGQIHIYANYSYGKLDGNYASYASNGKLLRKGNYLKGMKNGRWFIRDEQGILVKVKYKNGELKGGE